MPSLRLTALAIPKLKPDEYYDTIVPGLILRAGKRKRKWDCRFYCGGAYQREHLGYFPGVSLEAARDAARLMLDRAERGVTITPPAAPHPRSSDVLTLGGLLDRYEAMRKREGRKTKTLGEAMRHLRRSLTSYLAMPLTQFSKADLRAARDVLVEDDSPYAANRLLGYLSPVMKWAAEEDLVSTNFVRDIRKAHEQKRDRVLNKAEIAAIWHACGTLQSSEAARNFGRLVRFLLVTAQRRGEAAALRHGHILNGVWRQTDNKSSRPHSLTLPPLALRLIGKGEARAFVFAGGSRDGRIAGFMVLKAALDRASGVKDWRLHDLRRTAASNMQELKIRNEVVQLVLNHSLPGVGGVYLRSELEKEKAEALATWSVALARIVGPRQAVLA